MKRIDLIKAYFEKFDEGPPIYGMEEDEANRLMKKAIETGVKIEDSEDLTVPDDFYT